MRTLKERVESCTEVIPFHSCHEWTGTRDRDGYGRFKFGKEKKMIRANRAALELKLGRPLLRGEQSLHTCDNPGCVNPLHLFVGTALDNMKDKITKGRMSGPCADNKAKTHCKKGHPFSGKNLYVRPSGKRGCRRCHADGVNAANKRRRTRSLSFLICLVLLGCGKQSSSDVQVVLDRAFIECRVMKEDRNPDQLRGCVKERVHCAYGEVSGRYCPFY